ncbi:hypothetical protein HYH03_010103 [Edaphochlamys debaryana]|uniref:Phospholipase A1 n=1 Tax=Edaphochlamys debaryana TaxID=47281 RepID=A0A836BWI5_9CHLO|nr:hypothetical protein HYH03_010103 [Edaphochlamys debaryana]|eukprot:KAG2491530.1 hypothetical protein HYH03_010103 [Edaphochlamys debaryana]
MSADLNGDLREMLMHYGQLAQATYDHLGQDPGHAMWGHATVPPDALITYLNRTYPLPPGVKANDSTPLGTGTRYLLPACDIGGELSPLIYARAGPDSDPEQAEKAASNFLETIRTTATGLPAVIIGGSRPLFKPDPKTGRGLVSRSAFMGYVAVSTENPEDPNHERDAVFVWRGTIFKEEWAANFEQDRLVVRQWLKKLQKKYNITTVTTTGHSLGAALSTVSAYDIGRQLEDMWTDSSMEEERKSWKTKSKPKVTAIAFAPPRVGNFTFLQSFSDVYQIRQLRVCNVLDLVPQVPGGAMQYLTSALYRRGINMYFDMDSKAVRKYGAYYYWFSCACSDVLGLLRTVCASSASVLDQVCFYWLVVMVLFVLLPPFCRFQHIVNCAVLARWKSSAKHWGACIGVVTSLCLLWELHRRRIIGGMVLDWPSRWGYFHVGTILEVYLHFLEKLGKDKDGKPLTTNRNPLLLNKGADILVDKDYPANWQAPLAAPAGEDQPVVAAAREDQPAAAAAAAGQDQPAATAGEVHPAAAAGGVQPAAVLAAAASERPPLAHIEIQLAQRMAELAVQHVQQLVRQVQWTSLQARGAARRAKQAAQGAWKAASRLHWLNFLSRCCGFWRSRDQDQDPDYRKALKQQEEAVSKAAEQAKHATEQAERAQQAAQQIKQAQPNVRRAREAAKGVKREAQRAQPAVKRTLLGTLGAFLRWLFTAAVKVISLAILVVQIAMGIVLEALFLVFWLAQLLGIAPDDWPSKAAAKQAAEEFEEAEEAARVAKASAQGAKMAAQVALLAAQQAKDKVDALLRTAQRAAAAAPVREGMQVYDVWYWGKAGQGGAGRGRAGQGTVRAEAATTSMPGAIADVSITIEHKPGKSSKVKGDERDG